MKVSTFITITGDKLLGVVTGMTDETIFISYPVKIAIEPIMTPVGLYNQLIPSLYQPFGNQNVAFTAAYFISVDAGTDSDNRYYSMVLSQLLLAETKRLLALDTHYINQTYADKLICEPTTTLQ